MLSALDIFLESSYNIIYVSRGVAKLGIALGSGPRGRGFESRHSDQRHLLWQVPFYRLQEEI